MWNLQHQYTMKLQLPSLEVPMACSSESALPMNGNLTASEEPGDASTRMYSCALHACVSAAS